MNGGWFIMVRISACVIVKDEEDNMQQWLDGVKDIADEMIVVDTGSTDRTVEIAKEGGAHVYYYAWDRDFAAAKNYALSKAKGNWIVFLDADEYFSVQTRGKLRHFLGRIHGAKKINAVISNLYNIDRDNDNQIMSIMMQVRIFRNMKQLRYRGSIHEVLNPKVLCTMQTDFVIYHTGYSAGLIKRKNERNLALLLEDIKASGGEQPRHYIYLSGTYYNLKQYEKAIHYAKLAIRTKAKGLESTYINQYTNWLRAEKKLNASDETLQQIVDQALADVPDHPDMLWEDALLAFNHKDYVRAERKVTRLLERVKDKKFMRKYEATIYAKVPFLNYILGMIRELQGRTDEALDCYQQALGGYAYQGDMVESLLNLMSSRSSQEIIEYLNTIYDRDKDRDFLGRCLQNRPRDDVYLYYMRPSAGSYEALMGEGDYLGAERKAAGSLADIFDKAVDAYRQGKKREVWEVLLPQRWKDADLEDGEEQSFEEEALVGKAVKFMREMALAMLSLTAGEFAGCIQDLGLLPKGMQTCILHFHGDSGALSIGDADAYKTLWKEILRYGSSEIIEKFGLLAVEMDEKTILEAAWDLCGKKHWQAALALYQEISIDSELVDAEFWYHVGLCFFHCGETETAVECFSKAQEMDEQLPDPAWYLVWCREKKDEGGIVC